MAESTNYKFGRHSLNLWWSPDVGIQNSMSAASSVQTVRACAKWVFDTSRLQQELYKYCKVMKSTKCYYSEL